MIEFEVNGKRGKHVISLPTSLKEITSDYLLEVTKDVALPEHYSLIGVCYREKLSTIIMNARQNKNMTTAVVPVFIKSGTEDFTLALSAEKIIVSSSQLSLGYHVTCPKNNININNFVSYIEGDGYAYQNAIKANEYVYFLEFKIIPNSDIVGVYKDLKDDTTFDNPFKITPISTEEVD